MTHDSTTLRAVNADRLLLWLEDLIDLIEAEQTVNTLRPAAGALTASRIDPRHLPLYLRAPHLEIVGIYRDLPAHGRPFGAPVCTLGIQRPQPGAKAKQCTAPAPTGCKGEHCPYAGYMPVHLWCAETFPLTVHELRWLLEVEFVHVPTPWKPMPNVWLANFLGDTRASEFFMSRSRTTPQALLACNRWLERRLRTFDPAANVHQLYDAWLTRYEAERKSLPTDATRSFQRAVESARARIADKTQHQE